MYTNLPKHEIDSRIKRFQALMTELGVDISLIIYNPDLFYFTGVVQQGILMIEREDEPVFFVRRYHERAVAESPLRRIERINSPTEIVQFLGSKLKEVKRIGLELDVMPVNFCNRITQIFENKEFVDISFMVRRTRSVKSALEIELMRRSGRNLVRLMNVAGDRIKEGKKEHEVISDIVKFALDEGHAGTIRMRNWNQEIPFGHVLSGESGCVGSFADTPLGGQGRHPSSPFGPGDREIKAEEPIIVDIMWVEEGYITDMTRVFSIGEIHDQEITGAHDLAILILRGAEKRLKPHQSSKVIIEESRKLALEGGLEKSFMGLPGNNVKFLGHGIGIEVDEFPFFADGIDFTLEEGMTFALEPKFVLKGKGAVGVENTYLIKPEGFENLTEMEEGIIVI
jgi:Xaa-Pro dipeptidase